MKQKSEEKEFVHQKSQCLKSTNAVNEQRKWESVAKIWEQKDTAGSFQVIKTHSLWKYSVH